MHVSARFGYLVVPKSADKCSVVHPPTKVKIFFFAFLDESDQFQCFPKAFRNKLKSLKVAQVKDEIDDDENDVMLLSDVVM